MPFDFYPFIKVHPKAPPRPRLRIRVTEPNDQNRVEGIAFIDPGADCCFLPRSFAKRLKIKWRKGNKIKARDIAGKLRRGYEHSLPIEVYGILLDSKRPDNILFTDNPEIQLGETTVVFTSSLKEPVLGVRGFLDKYVYTIHHARMRYSLRNPHKTRDCEICRPG